MLIYVLAILMILVRYFSSLMITLRCHYEIQSSLEVDKLLHFAMALLSSSFEKKDYSYYNAY